MTWYYLYEIAITGVFDNLFTCFCLCVFYYLGINRLKLELKRTFNK